MKYEVYISRTASASFIVEADSELEAGIYAIQKAKSSHDFNNDGFPEYEITEVCQAYDYVLEE